MIFPKNNDNETYLFATLRNSLGLLLALMALNAFAGGYYGMSGAAGIPTEWLDGTPFSTYFFPSLFLFLVVGGACLLAAIGVFRKHPSGIKIAFVSSTIVIAWLILQTLLIGYVSWLQPATAVVALVILVLTIWISYNAA